MKDLQNKKHYCYKIHTLLMKSRAYPSSMDNPLIWTTSLPFLPENLDTPFYEFSEISTLPVNKGVGVGGVHTMTHELCQQNAVSSSTFPRLFPFGF